MKKLLSSARKHQQGFSLIEVLIGAVILATGLLALSALQGSLARNAADSRIRSQVAAALEAAAEADRATANFVGLDTATRSVTVPGVGSLTITGTCGPYTNVTTPGDSNASCTNRGGTASEAQFKQMIYSASWTDATGGSRSMTLTSIVSPRTMASNSTLPFKTPTEGVKSIAPIVRTPNPEVAGMIPIAIGDGSDTAATNPKPTIASGNVIRTSYEVLTYHDEGSNIVKQQRRVETAVIGCSCNAGTSPTGAQFERPQWPAYWDGNRYTIYTPSGNASAPGVAQPAIQSTGVTQDALCTECCRDHHDGAGDNTNVKFDPYRTDDHIHYALNGNSLTAAGNGADYLEVCRMVRVDGFWRTAQDLDAKHFGLLETANNAISSVPSSSASSTYETFVIDFLRANYLSGQTAQTANALYAAAGLDAPARIDISKPVATTDTRILHARGLYVDKVEPVAQAKINSAAASCTRTNAVECILPLLSFTSINVTEPAFWTSANTNQLTVDSDGVILFQENSPNRGRVNALSGATANVDSNINTSIFKSNSGLAVRNRGIDPQDDVAATDSQLFRVTGIGLGSGKSFTVRVYGWSGTDNAPVPSWIAGTGSLPCVGSGVLLGNGQNKYREYSCNVTTAFSLLPITVAIGRYNYSVPNTAAKNVTLTCPGVNPSPATYTFANNSKATLTACQNINVSSVSSVTGTISPVGSTNTTLAPNTGTDGNTAGTNVEITLLPFTTIDDGAVIRINLADQNLYYPTADSCPVAAAALPASTCP